MKLTLDSQVIDTIEQGDLLTVLYERESSYIIQTFNGQKGAVAKGNVAKLAEAVPIYDELIEQLPEEGRLYTLRASCFWALGDTTSALADYDRAIELGYDEAHAYSSRGLFHAAVGNYDQAIQDYSAAISRDPTDDVPLLNRASVFMSMGKYERAIDDYTAAAKLRPENATLYSQRAVAMKLVGNLSGAIADYDRAIELAESDVSAWMGRGFVHFQSGQYEAAISDFNRVIELSPESAVAINNRGYNYQMLKQESRALDDYTRAIELAPGYLLALQNKAWMLTVATDAKLRNPVGAIEIATKVCEISEYKNFADLTLLAAAYASAGEFETAIGWQEKALTLASGVQADISHRILEGYASGKPLDPKILQSPASNSEASSERPPSPSKRRSKAN
jgi:tetratricopeptide (TPR) repeat protein